MPLNNPVLARTITTGSYTGNGAANRAIAHGLKVTPSVVFIMGDGAAVGLNGFMIIGALGVISGFQAAAGKAVTIPNGTNFYVGNATSYPDSANALNEGYKWVAIE